MRTSFASMLPDKASEDSASERARLQVHSRDMLAGFKRSLSGSPILSIKPRPSLQVIVAGWQVVCCVIDHSGQVAIVVQPFVKDNYRLDVTRAAASPRNPPSPIRTTNVACSFHLLWGNAAEQIRHHDSRGEDDPVPLAPDSLHPTDRDDPRLISR